MANTINYAEIYSNQLRELYGQESKSDALYHSNADIQLNNGKSIKIPTLSVSGYKDHTRASLPGRLVGLKIQACPHSAQSALYSQASQVLHQKR